MKTKAVTRAGRRIRDAKDDLLIRIKPEHIKGAVCRDHQKCVIAKSLMSRAGVKWVDVGASTVLVGTGKKTCRRYLLNGLGKEQLRFFDTHDGAFAPCAVKLKAPPRQTCHGYAKRSQGALGSIWQESAPPSAYALGV